MKLIFMITILMLSGCSTMLGRSLQCGREGGVWRGPEHGYSNGCCIKASEPLCKMDSEYQFGGRDNTRYGVQHRMNVYRYSGKSYGRH